MEYLINLKTLGHIGEVKAKCAILEIGAAETKIQAHAYCNGIDFQQIQDNVMHSTNIVIIEKSTNTIICYHYFDMLEYNNNIIDVILAHTTFRITSIGAMRNTISLKCFFKHYTSFLQL